MTQSTFHRFEASVNQPHAENGHPERHRPLFRRVLSRIAPVESLPELEPVELPEAQDPHAVDLWEAFSAYATAQFDGERRDGGVDRARQGFQRLLDLNGINATSAKALSLGLYTTPEDVRVYLRSVGFSEAAIEDSGLVTDAEGRLRHDWSGCIVGPVRDRFGSVVDLFSLQSGTTWQPARYRFLHGFSETLAVGYGADKAFGSEFLPGRVILVDDLLDAVALHDAGIRNVLAIGGSGADFTPDRWEQLADLGVLEVELVFRQSAQRDGSVRSALEHALKARRAPQVWVLDSSRFGELTSPGDYVRRFGATAFLATIASPALAFYGKEFGGRRFVTYPSSATARFAAVPVAPVVPQSYVLPPVMPNYVMPAYVAPEPVAPAPVVEPAIQPTVNRFDRTAYLTAMRPCIDRYAATAQERSDLWRQIHGIADALEAGHYQLARERTAALPAFDWTAAMNHSVNPWHHHFAHVAPDASYSQYAAYAPFTPFAPYSTYSPAPPLTQPVFEAPVYQPWNRPAAEWTNGDWRTEASIDRLCCGSSLPYGVSSTPISGESEPHPLTLLTIASRADRLQTAATTLLDELAAADATTDPGVWLVGCDCHPDELMLHLVTAQANRLASGPGHSLHDVQCRMRGVEPATGFQDKPWLIDEAIDRLRTMQSRFAFVPTSYLLDSTSRLVMPETGQQPTGVIYVAESFAADSRYSGTYNTPYGWLATADAPFATTYRRDGMGGWGMNWTASFATDFATTLSNRLAGECRLIAVVPPTRTDVPTLPVSYRPVPVPPVAAQPVTVQSVPVPFAPWTPLFAHTNPRMGSDPYWWGPFGHYAGVPADSELRATSHRWVQQVERQSSSAVE